MNFTSDIVGRNNTSNNPTVETILIFNISIFTVSCLLFLFLAALACCDGHHWQQRRWLYAPSFLSLYLFIGVSIFTTSQAQDLWDHTLLRYTGSTGTPQRAGLNLSTLVMHGNEVYLRNEWRWNKKNFVSLLRGTLGEEIKVGC